MYTEEEKFRQTEATVIKSTKNSEGNGRIEVNGSLIEVMNIKVRFPNNLVGSTLSLSPRPTSYHINAR